MPGMKKAARGEMSTELATIRVTFEKQVLSAEERYKRDVEHIFKGLESKHQARMLEELRDKIDTHGRTPA